MILLATIYLTNYFPQISIYDSPSDKTKVVVEVCTERPPCDRLVTPKKTLQNDYEKIQEWVNKMIDKSTNSL
jgi:hypothetical protein